MPLSPDWMRKIPCFLCAAAFREIMPFALACIGTAWQPFGLEYPLTDVPRTVSSPTVLEQGLLAFLFVLILRQEGDMNLHLEGISYTRFFFLLREWCLVL